ncbi:MAG: ArsJ-associated glyceraldehyde-3-phosphate dehydrogenase [Baekduiaceae bacterium]
MTRIAINGFGRMGRLALRAAWDRDDVEVVHVNDVASDPVTSAHLLAFDSVHGRWAHEAHAEDDAIVADGRRIGHSSHGTPGEIPWEELGVDLVLECTGRFKTGPALEAHLRGDVRRVVVAAPVKDGSAKNIVVGVNDDTVAAEDRFLTAASCTTNCLAPLVKVIHEGLGIARGSITTLHDLTNTQTIVDAPHKDLRRARAAGRALIPTTTGSATAIGLIFPELQGKRDGLAVRVPLLNAALADAVFEVQRSTSVEEVNGLLRAASEAGPLAGILGYEVRPLVSVDFVDDPRSSIVDALSTMVTDGTQVKVLAWYDNEWGYANRMVELAAYASSLG